MVVLDAYGVDLSSASQFISTQLTMWPLVCFFFMFIASSFMSTSNYDIIGMRFIPFYSAKRQPVRIGVYYQARATFFGRGPHQYFDRMSRATRPESFTSMIITCYSMNTSNL